jgi:hypothetical protein
MSTQLTPASGAVPTWTAERRALHVGRGEAFVLAACAAAIGYAMWSLRAVDPDLVNFREDAMGRVATVLAPLVLVAAMIERAVEVIITSWREPVARQLQAELDFATAQDPSGTSPAVQHATTRLRNQKSDTLQVAFMLSFTASQRTREVGIRVALGGRPRHVVALLFRGPMAQIVLGILIGLVIADRLSEGDMVRVIAVYGCVVVAISALATLGPVRRALRIQPVDALRAE